MAERDDRIRLSREDIGILMSFATQPERFTDDVISRLVTGVTKDELADISSWLGLPQSTTSRLFSVAEDDRARAGGRRIELSRHYRRAIVGLLGFFVIMSSLTLRGSDQSGFNAAFLIAAISLTAYLIYRLLIRLASGSLTR